MFAGDLVNLCSFLACRRHFDLVVAQEFSLTLQPVHAVLFEQPGDSPGQFLYDPVFPADHLMDIHLDAGDIDAVLRGAMTDEGIMVG